LDFAAFASYLLHYMRWSRRGRTRRAPPPLKKRIGVIGLAIYFTMCMCSGYMCII
jgi:hypothetical protein